MVTTRTLLAAAALAASHAVEAHTWVEYIRRVSPSGSFVGEIGYARGFKPRNTPGFADDQVQNKMIDLTANPAVCRQFPNGGYSDPKYPPLTASPGETLAMQWLENGHVTAPDLTPRGYRSGNVYIYGTTKDGSGLSINDVMYKWNQEGTGGNKQGELLASHFYDDGRCYQKKGAEGKTFPVWVQRTAKTGDIELPCQGAVKLPSDLPKSGTYTLIWVWDWPLKPNEVGTVNEVYTSCATINLKAASGDVTAKADAFKQNADPLQAAIQSQLATYVEVLTRGTGAASPPAPTKAAKPTEASSSAPAPTDAPTTTAPPSSTGGAAPGGDGGIKTVTVTAPASTVIVNHTTTVNGGVPAGTGAPVGTGGSAAPTQPSGKFSVTPFMRAKVKARATGYERRMRV